MNNPGEPLIEDQDHKEGIMRTTAMVGFMAALALVLAEAVTAAPPLAANFTAHLDGGNSVPERDTLATGQAIFQINDDDRVMTYRLIVANIENVVASHIHLGVPGVNGPVVASLAGPFPPAGGRVDGVLAEGTITAANLVGPLAGMSLAVLAAAMRDGGTYVNVHTNNGVDPANEGPGDFPAGEVRGPIRPNGP